MIYAFVSDIHANLQAWNVVLADIRARKVDSIVCLGDIVGYGPRPAEVLSSVYSHVPEIVLGNHDAVVADLLDVDLFNDDAKRMIQWTKKQLGPKAVEFFNDLPYVIGYDGFAVSHADFSDPEAFNYLEDEEYARLSWEAEPEEDLMFIGHTHVPCIHMLKSDDSYRFYDPIDFHIEEGNRYIVNVGSVGIPRGDDIRASYVTFNTEDKSVNFHKVAFDLDAFRKDVETIIGKSKQTDYILRQFDQTATSVREQIDFSAIAPESRKRKSASIVVRKSKATRKGRSNPAGIHARHVKPPKKSRAGVVVLALILLGIIGGLLGWVVHLTQKKPEITAVQPPPTQQATAKKPPPTKQATAKLSVKKKPPIVQTGTARGVVAPGGTVTTYSQGCKNWTVHVFDSNGYNIESPIIMLFKSSGLEIVIDFNSSLS